MSNLKQSKNSHGASKKNNKAFAVLFSILLASFLITLGISIFSISLKEIQIITSSRDSQIAYYAADSARECALYWDIKKGAFPPCFDNNANLIECTSATIPKINPTINCNNQDIPLTFSRISNSSYTLAKLDFFKFSPTDISVPISDLEITKTFNVNRITTRIIARGHNTGVLGRRVERGISITSN